MKFVIEFDDNDIGEFIEEFGDDIKDYIRKRIKAALTEEFGDDIKESIMKRKKTALDSALASYYNDYRNRVRKKIEENSNGGWYPVSKKTFGNKEEAEEILDRMYEILLRFNNVTVYDYYKLVDFELCDYDRNYGWTDLKCARVKPIYTYGDNRWTIELPKPVCLHRYDQVE